MESIPPANRSADLTRIYGLIDELAARSGGLRHLSGCSGRMDWPMRGVYFFYEPGEDRLESGSGPRIVRVGTHALKAGSKTTLWRRLSQHKGPQSSGGGNHRGSIFRLLVGAALQERDSLGINTWGKGSSAPLDIRQGEVGLEQQVSKVIGAMPFVCLGIDDEAGPASLRGTIERNVIALLSNAGTATLDQASEGWLGHHCPRDRVRASGLWNQNHTTERYNPAFLDVLESQVLMTKGSS